MRNILFNGSPGTGKTFLARAAAYYICQENINLKDLLTCNFLEDISKIEGFVNSNRCEFIQVHPSMSYEDIVYGIDIKTNGRTSLSYAEKRIKLLCDNAIGKADKFCIIFDDIDRCDAGSLLGNISYAMEYRNQPISLSDEKMLIIPDNIILIFTECKEIHGGRLDYALRRRIDCVIDLEPNRTVLVNYYDGYVDSLAANIIIEIFDIIYKFILNHATQGIMNRSKDYVPGHGMFMVERIGTPHLVLDLFKQRLIYQVFPYLETLNSNGIINGELTNFFNTIEAMLNTGVATLNNICNVQKVMAETENPISSFSLADTINYYITEIIPNKSVDHKGILESVVDAIVLNGVFPLDMAVSALLTNINLIGIPSKTTPVTYASYIVEKSESRRYYYETPKGAGKARHDYYSTNKAKVGRWAEKGMAAYSFFYTDGKPCTTFVLLNGFRIHGFTDEVNISNNAINFYASLYWLVLNYLKLYKQNISLIKGNDIVFVDLDHLLLLEIKYFDELHKNVGKQTGKEAKLDFIGKKLMSLRTLWSVDGTMINVDEQKFHDLVTGKKPFSIEAYEDIYNFTSGTKKTIEIRGVVKMTDLSNYQQIMENIGVRQMIFQGPPGTSKTFDSKKFVLSQLDDTLPLMTQEDISAGLERYKLTYADYENPRQSLRFTTGGWDLVQFHPSYGYEDFIRGIEVRTNNGIPSYNSINRILGKIAEFAKMAENASTSEVPPRFYLIIDEINRANLATVFGELIYGLEYRDSKVSTPYEVDDKAGAAKTKDIVLGKNLFIVGTMNTADKSTAAIDYAIRRRFIFIDSSPNRNVVINCYRNVSSNNDENSIELLLFDAVQAVFENENYFNNEYQKSDVKLGHTYFLRQRKLGYEDDIIERFVFQIVPILREYVKDGILDTIEYLQAKEHTATDIKSAPDWQGSVQLLSDNIILFAKEFGNKNNVNEIIDNEYIGNFIKELLRLFEF